MAMYYIGVRRFLGLRERRRQLIIFCTGVTLIAAYFTYIQVNVAARLVNLAIGMAVLSLLSAHTLLARKTRSLATSTYSLALVFLAQGIILVAFRRKDGSEFHGLLSARIIYLKGIACVIKVIRDVTERKRAEDAERRVQELLSHFLRHSPIYTYIKEVTPSENRVLQASDNFEQMLGVSGREMVGKTMSDLFPSEFAATITADDWAVVAGGETLKTYETFNDRNYTSIRFPIVHGSKTLLAGYTIDITERITLERKLQQQAATDDLTGVTNRRRFMELAQTETKRAIRYEHPLALALIDIDNFMRINDVYGHAAGDQALLMLVQICRKSIRDIDVFARYGGDEFAVLLPETGRAEAGKVMQRLCLGAAAEPVDLGDGPIAISISAGIATLAGNEDSLDALLARADHALYQAKRAGRNRVVMAETATE